MIETPRSLHTAIACGLVLLTPVVQAATKGAAPPPAATANTPEQVVRQFLQAENAGDDDKAYALLSAASKRKTTMKEWQDRAHQVRSTFSAISLVAGEALLIGGGGFARNTVGASTATGDRATVKIVQTLPIPNTLHLVKENGRWAIDIQRTLGGGESTAPTAPKPSSPPPPRPTTTVPPAAPDLSLQCRSNLRSIGLALKVYALDHNGQLPDAAKWTDEILPYLDSPNLLKCPPDSPAASSYAMNAALSGTKLSDIPQASTRVVLYDTTTTDRNVSGHGQTLPATAPHPSGYLVLMANGEATFVVQRPAVQ